MFGFPVLDPLASVVICIFILKVAFDIFKDALDKMLDTSCSEEYEEKLADYIRKYKAYCDSCKSGIMEKNTAAFKF